MNELDQLKQKYEEERETLLWKIHGIEEKIKEIDTDQEEAKTIASRVDEIIKKKRESQTT